MAKTSAQDRRAAGREKRRGARNDEPIEEAVEAVDGDPADALRAAASAAIAGAAVGAARAFARRRQTDEDEPDEPEATTDEEPEAQPEPEQEPQPQPEPAEEPRRAAPAGDTRRIVQRAREQLSELHGAEAESVSAVRRTADGWRVGLEVVEVHRIPESTDVLATYEVEMDDDGELLTFERTSRYYRSEADRR